ncbi:MAG: Tex-like N-terminal domain-containing protein, partial [Paracoccaceae bacterium]
MTLARIPQTIATEIAASAAQVSAAIALLDEGATVPFIARYRKEVTGGLDDTQLRNLAERLVYLRELEARRVAIAASITEQGKMTDALAGAVAKAVTKAELEDIYLPFKPKRRTKAMIARENGLQALVDAVLADRRADPVVLAGAYVNEAVPDTKAALEGARDIIAEGLAERADLLGRLRDHMRRNGRLVAGVVAGKEAEGAKFSDYFAHSEPFASAPSHRVLAMLRGRNEGILSVDLAIDAAAPRGQSEGERACAAALQAAGAGAGDVWLREAAAWAFRIKIKTSLTLDLMGD